MASNAVTAPKIKDGEVKVAEIASDAVGASEIATNAVGANEIAGVGDLFFAECTKTSNTLVAPGAFLTIPCDVEGAGSGDVAIATVSKGGNSCFAVTNAPIFTNRVHVVMRNTYTANNSLGPASIAIVVFDTTGVIILTT